MSDLATYTTTIQDRPAGMAWFMNEDGGDGIYYSDQLDGDRIYRWSLNLRSRELIWDGPAYGLYVEGKEWLYFIDERTQHLCRLRTDCRSVTETIQTVVDQPVLCYTIRKDHIYYSTPTRIERCGRDGARPEILTTASASSLVVVGEWLVFVDRGREYALTVIGLNGREREQLKGVRTLFLNQDDRYIYFCNDLSSQTVHRLDPSSGKIIRICGDSAAWLHLIDGQLYFWHDRSWYAMSLSGGQPQKVSE